MGVVFAMLLIHNVLDGPLFTKKSIRIVSLLPITQRFGSAWLFVGSATSERLDSFSSKGRRFPASTRIIGSPPTNRPRRSQGVAAGVCMG